MDDLIERLEAILAASEPADSQWRYWDSDDGAVAVNVHPSEFQAALRQAAAALEAAREDVERLDFLDSRRGDDVQPEPGSGDPVLVAHYWSVEGQCYDVRTAIDAEREARNG